jgi:TonB family protein
VGVALALNAESVNDYVYNEPKTPQKKVVKKGRQDGKIKMAVKTIEVKDAKTTNANSVEVVTAEKSDKDQKAVVMEKDSAKTVVPVVSMDSPEAEGAFDVVEKMPEFPGGVEKLMEYVAMNVRYPKEAEDKCLQGRVIATFIVEKDGSITSAKIVRSIDPALDAEALRVINGMPNWKPGTQKGEPVRVKYTIPISFRLQGGGDIPAENVKGANVMNETVVVGYGPENEPYVIVDGKPIDGSKLKEIDPKTIDHMEVLKSQTAIEKYGEKAKNGVIIITTKK